MRIVGDPECPLCGCVSSREEAFFPERTDGLPVDPARELFHPTGLHWSCYLQWPGRAEFAKRLFERQVKEAGTLWGRAYLNEQIAVFVFVAKPHRLKLLLSEIGCAINATTLQWEQCRADAATLAPTCHPAERAALHRALGPIWERFSSTSALIEGTDWSGTERHLYA